MRTVPVASRPRTPRSFCAFPLANHSSCIAPRVEARRSDGPACQPGNHMTIMRVALIGATLAPEQKAELSRRLISAFCEVEVGLDVELAHPGFVVHIEEVAADNVFVGDTPMTAASSVGRAAI